MNPIDVKKTDSRYGHSLGYDSGDSSDSSSGYSLDSEYRYNLGHSLGYDLGDSSDSSSEYSDSSDSSFPMRRPLSPFMPPPLMQRLSANGGPSHFDSIMAFVGDPSQTACVSKNFRALTENSFSDIWRSYERSPVLAKYIALANPQGTSKQKVQQVYSAVMGATASDHIQSRVAELNRAPLLLSSVVNRIEDANLVQVFSVVLRQISADDRPEINPVLDIGEQARLIRKWMKESQEILDRIAILCLSFKNLTTLPMEIGLFTGLQVLDLHGNRLTDLPRSFGNLAQLRDLELCCNRLTELPDWIGNLAQLRNLDLDGNRLTDLPRSLGNLAQLRTLNLHGNRLTDLPDWIGNLAQLRDLRLGWIQITVLPRSLGNLAQLRYLDLKGSQITELPEWVDNLAQLRIFQ